jgi:hypothetical protein
MWSVGGSRTRVLHPSRPQRQQTRIAPGRGGVHGQRALGGEAREVVRAAGLGPGAGQAFAAEGLHPDHRADDVAVDVAVAGAHAALDVRDGAVDAAVDAEREPVTGGVDRVDHGVEVARGVAHHVQDRAEHLAGEGRQRRDLVGARAEEGAVRAGGAGLDRADQARLAVQARGVLDEDLACVLVDQGIGTSNALFVQSAG